MIVEALSFLFRCGCGGCCCCLCDGVCSGTFVPTKQKWCDGVSLGSLQSRAIIIDLIICECFFQFQNYFNHAKTNRLLLSRPISKRASSHRINDIQIDWWRESAIQFNTNDVCMASIACACARSLVDIKINAIDIRIHNKTNCSQFADGTAIAHNQFIWVKILTRSRVETYFVSVDIWK